MSAVQSMRYVVAVPSVEDSGHLGARRCVSASSRGEVSFFANSWRFAIYGSARYICRFTAATAIRRVCNAKHLNSVISRSIFLFSFFLIRTITLPFPLIFFLFLCFVSVFVFLLLNDPSRLLLRLAGRVIATNSTGMLCSCHDRVVRNNSDSG